MLLFINIVRFKISTQHMSLKFTLNGDPSVLHLLILC